MYWINRDFLCEFPRICLNTTEKDSLAVWGSLTGDKPFFLIFVPFKWFDQKQLFIQIQIFFRICPFSNLLRKTNFLSVSVLFSEILPFCTKKNCEFPRKCFKTTEKHTAKTILFCCVEAYSGKFTEKISIYSIHWLSQKGARKYSES